MESSGFGQTEPAGLPHLSGNTRLVGTARAAMPGLRKIVQSCPTESAPSHREIQPVSIFDSGSLT
jgi:hypothetical protein